ncbi:hypothetical protein [Octadecabacter ascidiaceicola]|uniref:hypothetical protein n=1 Tax=Octadecabacter ascidiaceicola TaxID=1655543 RepID=UPI000B8A8D43|nr:hypothetical protein [Octadecabacter ascidiaceicola]
MADGMALATFIRAKVLDEQLPRRKRRSSASIADKLEIAQILGLLGQRHPVFGLIDSHRTVTARTSLLRCKIHSALFSLMRALFSLASPLHRLVYVLRH